MSGFLEIALDVFWLVIIVGGGGWLLIRTLKKSEDPSKNVFKIIFSIVLVAGEVLFVRHQISGLSEGADFGNFPQAFMMTISIAACGVVLSIVWTPQISGFIFSPLTNIFDGGNEPVENKPFYSIANAKRKRGLYHEAVSETRKQLDKFPNDFEGIMLLAGIQAENMNDLQAAENTLNHFCAEPKAPEKQVAAAWTAMADWHLKFGVDVDSARAALQKIVERYPETELALRAEQRLAHLGDTEKILMGQHDRQRIVVPEGVKNLGLLDSTAFLQPKEIAPGKLAAAHVKHLETHPHDSEVREKLAVIYAKDFQRLDLATLELMQLINEPRHAPKQVANWLNLLANFQVELGADLATVRATLEQIVTRFPDLPLADVTRRRLARINSEFKGKVETPGVKLGEYEQNIGLKYGAPGKQ
jgi:tetratricopeptide (TPR) repeat protein